MVLNKALQNSWVERYSKNGYKFINTEFCNVFYSDQLYSHIEGNGKLSLNHRECS